jgi:glycine betaine/proline transport system ATP-binding protein
MIEVTDLWKVFGPGDHRASVKLATAGATRSAVLEQTGQTIGVHNVSFEVGTGESFVVMGLSGSGKSTLIRCLAGLHPMTAGDVRIGNQSLAGIDEAALRTLRRTKMAMVFQHFGLLPHRTVLDNIAYGLEVQGVAKTTRRSRAHDTLSIVGLDGWANHYPDQLSGGMQQRVGLARALVLDPEVLFFDEPFSALDPLIRNDMQSELLRLQQARPRTIVFITHDFDEALRLGDRIAVMKDGRLEQVGTPEAVVTHPATDYVRAFTQNVSIGKVVKVGSIMTAPDAASAAPLRTVSSHALLDTLMPMFLADRSPISVTDGNHLVGIVSPDSLLSLLTESR